MTVRSRLSSPEAWSPLEAALVAYHDLGEPAEILVANDLGDPQVLPASIFFRTEGEIEEWEAEALDRCGEMVLDVGAGVGAHALILQGRGRRVTALETLPGAVRIMGERGVEDARLGTLIDLPLEAKYDTVLMLMNGSMLAETLAGLDTLLDRIRRVLRPGGSFILDSTDLRDSDAGLDGFGSDDARSGDADTADVRSEYAAAGPSDVTAAGPSDATAADVGPEEAPSDVGPADGRYHGELHFQLSYQGIRGQVFPQLFIDPDTLEARARSRGWKTAVLWRGEAGRFLAELTSA